MCYCSILFNYSSWYVSDHFCSVITFIRCSVFNLFSFTAFIIVCTALLLVCALSWACSEYLLTKFHQKLARFDVCKQNNISECCGKIRAVKERQNMSFTCILVQLFRPNKTWQLCHKPNKTLRNIVLHVSTRKSHKICNDLKMANLQKYIIIEGWLPHYFQNSLITSTALRSRNFEYFTR